MTPKYPKLSMTHHNENRGTCTTGNMYLATVNTVKNKNKTERNNQSRLEHMDTYYGLLIIKKPRLRAVIDINDRF